MNALLRILAWTLAIVLVALPVVAVTRPVLVTVPA